MINIFYFLIPTKLQLNIFALAEQERFRKLNLKPFFELPPNPKGSDPKKLLQKASSTKISNTIIFMIESHLK